MNTTSCGPSRTQSMYCSAITSSVFETCITAFGSPLVPEV
jgi:hypothetical protein